jgi:hypothetical protein
MLLKMTEFVGVVDDGLSVVKRFTSELLNFILPLRDILAVASTERQQRVNISCGFF